MELVVKVRAQRLIVKGQQWSMVMIRGGFCVHSALDRVEGEDTLFNLIESAQVGNIPALGSCVVVHCTITCYLSSLDLLNRALPTSFYTLEDSQSLWHLKTTCPSSASWL